MERKGGGSTKMGMVGNNREPTYRSEVTSKMESAEKGNCSPSTGRKEERGGGRSLGGWRRGIQCYYTQPCICERRRYKEDVGINFKGKEKLYRGLRGKEDRSPGLLKRAH